MSDGQDQDKSEEATPFKLRKAREKGQVARGLDLGFVGSLMALGATALMFGEVFVSRIAQLMRHALGAGVIGATDPRNTLSLTRDVAWVAFQPLIVLGIVLLVILVLLELLQLRGFVFTAHPLRPDFKRLNPAQGLKRLFSLRMLKETLKNLVKFGTYTLAAWWVIEGAIETYGARLTDARQLAVAIAAAGGRVLAVFVFLAFFFMVIDQIIARGEFRKQMRMSRRDITRETKDREGEPRLKQKRRDLHAQLREQTEGLGKVAGSDLLVVNPEHFAVALKYDPATMDAPIVRTKGRNHFAQLMKRKARLLGVPVIPDPALARGLFHATAVGQSIPSRHYHGVAMIYRRLPGLHDTQPAAE